MTVQLGTFKRSDSFIEIGGDKELRDMLLGIVLDFEYSRPRSQQQRVGPSEIGEPCVRKLAYKVSGFPEPAPGSRQDPWFAIMGTAIHAWLADALAHRNKQLGYERWLIEQRVTVQHMLDGSCDAFDTDTGTVIDHKVVGKSNHDNYRLHGLSTVYDVQRHLYGKGWANQGREVKTVSIALYPRFTDLGRGLHVISDPYDPKVADGALHRLGVIQELVRQLSPAQDPQQFRRLPRTPGPSCRYCPWLQPGGDTGATCPGNTAL